MPPMFQFTRMREIQQCCSLRFGFPVAFQSTRPREAQVHHAGQDQVNGGVSIHVCAQGARCNKASLPGTSSTIASFNSLICARCNVGRVSGYIQVFHVSTHSRARDATSRPNALYDHPQFQFTRACEMLLSFSSFSRRYSLFQFTRACEMLPF